MHCSRTLWIVACCLNRNSEPLRGTRSVVCIANPTPAPAFARACRCVRKWETPFKKGTLNRKTPLPWARGTLQASVLPLWAAALRGRLHGVALQEPGRCPVPGLGTQQRQVFNPRLLVNMLNQRKESMSGILPRGRGWGGACFRAEVSVFEMGCDKIASSRVCNMQAPSELTLHATGKNAPDHTPSESEPTSDVPNNRDPRRGTRGDGCKPMRRQDCGEEVGQEGDERLFHHCRLCWHEGIKQLDLRVLGWRCLPLRHPGSLRSSRWVTTTLTCKRMLN